MALTVPTHIRDSSNVVEHVPGGEEKDGDQADSGPEVPVLDHGKDIRSRHGDQGDKPYHGGADDGDLHVVDRAYEGGMWDGRELAGDPGVDGFRCVGARDDMLADEVAGA